MKPTAHSPQPTACSLGRAAFTLIELIVVVAVIALLIALLIPNIRMAREKAWSATCQNNLKQYGMALNTYLMSIGSSSGGGGSGGDLGVFGISATGTVIIPGTSGEMVTLVDGQSGTLNSGQYTGGAQRGGLGGGGGGSGQSDVSSILNNLTSDVTLQSLTEGKASVRVCPAVLRQIQAEGNFFDPNSPNRKGYQERYNDPFVYADFQGSLNIITNLSESELEEDTHVGYTLEGELILSSFTTYAGNPYMDASSPQNAIAFIDWNAKEGWGATLTYTNWQFNNPDASPPIVQGTPKWTNAWWLTEVGFYHPSDNEYGANYVAMDGHVGWISSNDITQASFTDGVEP